MVAAEARERTSKEINLTKLCNSLVKEKQQEEYIEAYI